MKTNITLKLDTNLLKEVRVFAAEEGRSISALLTDRLGALVRERKVYDRSRRRAVARLREASTSVGRLPRLGTSSMSDRHDVDTNILVYAHDRSASAKHERARALVEKLWTSREGWSWRANRISFWDAMIVHAAQVAGADVLCSEGLFDGQTYGSVRVVNPLRLA